MTILLVIIVGATTAGMVSAAATPTATDTAAAIESTGHGPASIQDSQTLVRQNSTQSNTDPDPESADESDNSTDVGAGSSGGTGNESDETTEPTTEPAAVLDVSPDVDAGTSITLDASASDPGDAEIEEYVWEITGSNEYETSTSEPTLEYTFDDPGTTTVGLEIVTDDDRRAETSTTVDVVDESPRIEGRIVRDSSRSDSRDRVRLVDENNIVASERMDEDGSFTLSPDEPGTYDLVIYEDALRDETQRTTRNWNVDLYALGTVTVGDDETVDVGTLEVPEGHTLETVVVENESERPIKNATVTYRHRNDGATISHDGVTDGDGEAFLGWDVPEVAGDVEIVVEPPVEGDYADPSVTETITVDEPTTTKIRLRKAVNASLEVESGANPNATSDPEPVSVGENVTVTLDETSGAAETVTWTVDGQERIGTSAGDDPADENRTMADSSENGTTAPSLEVRVTELEEFNVTAEVEGALGTTRTVSTTVPVTEPDRTVEFEMPDRTATHTSFPTTVTHEAEHGNVSVERYEWLLRDDDGELVAAEQTTDPAAEFAVERVGQYTLELEIEDEFGLTDSATTTVEADSVPSWVTGGQSRFEIETVEAPNAVEPGGSIPLEVSTTNVGDASGIANVTVEVDGDTLADERLELGVGETESIGFSPPAPDRLGNHTLTVATDHERTTVAYAVTENPDSSAATAASRPDSDVNAEADDEPQELELLPTPSTAADIEPPSPSRDRLRTVLLGTAAVAILGGFGLVGYVVYTRPERGPVTVTTTDSAESSDSS